MEKLKGAKIVRLMSQLTKEYLKSNSSKGGVELDYMSAERDMCWFVELLDNNPEVVALKNYHTGNYLAATADGTQLILSDGLAEWIPLKVGSSHIKLKTRDGNFLQVDHYPHPRGPILTTVDNNFTALWAVDVIRQADCYSSLPTVSSTFTSVSFFFFISLVGK
ncbi:hypothetical protein RND81_05G178800 [Saponaria officinalis]|uniref:DUF569 domain-containing protein n=1 Tax=Saponaria officinalis TaxID=3572 RepID=A0AAW1KZE7_SAPOF